MLKEFGKLNVRLGDVQRHIRNDISLPIGGGPDVLAAIHTRKPGNQIYKATSGESYIVLARFSSEGLPKIQTIHAYGSSARSENPHYTDQMQQFVDQKLKSMTLDTAKVYEEAVTIYYPLRI